MKATAIPPDKSSYGVFAILADETRKQTEALIKEAAEPSSNAGAESRKVGDFYSSFMDEAAIEAKGIAPLKTQLDKISAIRDRRELARVIGGTLRADVDPLNSTNFETDNLFGVWVTQGLTDPTHSGVSGNRAFTRRIERIVGWIIRPLFGSEIVRSATDADSSLHQSSAGCDDESAVVALRDVEYRNHRGGRNNESGEDALNVDEGHIYVFAAHRHHHGCRLTVLRCRPGDAALRFKPCPDGSAARLCPCRNSARVGSRTIGCK